MAPQPLPSLGVQLAAVPAGEQAGPWSAPPPGPSAAGPSKVGGLLLVAGSGQVTLLYDTGGGLYSLGIAGATTVAEAQARISFA